MLAAPPAAAMTYVNPSNGLDPSVYGGGGSPSSRSLLLPSLSFGSLGSAALVSATTELAAADAAAEDTTSSNGGAGPQGAKEVRDSVPTHSVTSARYGS